MVEILSTGNSNSQLTVVVPVHNMSGRLANLSTWLEEAGDLNVKVILVHDVSCDSTDTELKELVAVKNKSHISTFQVRVKSPGLARNAGLEAIDTPWFSFADSDDIVNVSSLLKLLQVTKSSGSEMGIGAYISNDVKRGTSRLITPPLTDEISLALHLTQSLGLWRFLFSTEQFAKIRFTKHRMGEDYLFVNAALSLANKIKTSPEVVYTYFHGGSWNLTSDKSVSSEMFGVIDILKTQQTKSEIARKFRRLATYKLILSLFKNVPLQVAVNKKLALSASLALHPIELIKLLNYIQECRKEHRNA